MTESLQVFPPLNASLNGLAGILLLAGYVMIRRGDRRAHAVCMIGAVTASVLFLGSYLTYHALKGDVHTTFPEHYPVARKFYYPMLISHIILAAVNLPMIIVTVTLAAMGRFELHRRWARIAFPIWLYVSVTGVLVYFMLYQWYLPPEKSAAASQGAAALRSLQAP